MAPCSAASTRKDSGVSDDNEAKRLQERAERIHGKNPFSPEAMAQDAYLEDERRRTGKAQRIYTEERTYDS